MRSRLVLILLCATSILWAAPRELDLFSEAESRYLAKNYTAALEAYNAFIAAYPLSERIPDVQYRKAVCLYRLDRWADAIDLLDDIQRKYRTTRYLSRVPFWKGMSLYSLSSYARAMASFDEFLAGESDAELTPQALLHKGLAQIALGSDLEAQVTLRTLSSEWQSASVFPYSVVLLTSLLEKSSSFDELSALTERIDPAQLPPEWKDRFLLSKAAALWEKGKSDEARAIDTGLREAEPDVALTAYRRLFIDAEKRGDLAGMRDLTLSAEVKFAGDKTLLAELWTRVGAESFRRGSLDTAELFLQRVWGLLGSVNVSEIVPLYLSEIALGRGQHDQARKLLEDYVAAGMKNPALNAGAARIRIGDIALMSEDYAAAASVYGEYLAENPDSPRADEVKYLLAFCLLKQGNIADSSRLVDELLARDTEENLRKDLLALRVTLFKREDRLQDAAKALAELVALSPGDLGARVDSLKVSFRLKQYGEVVSDATAFFQRTPNLREADANAFLVASYLRGLSLIAGKEYRRAIPDLEAITATAAEKAGLGVIVPYARYYLGWALVRTSSFEKAAAVFDNFAADFPRHELLPVILYLSGWSYFSLGSFDRSSARFASSAKGSTDVEFTQRSLYLYAKSLLNMKKPAEAADVFRAIAERSPPSSYSDDALFDYAGILSEAGDARRGAETYMKLVDSFADSPLREEAYYRRAEAFLGQNMFSDAGAAFADYRLKYPRGKLVDASLYWGGHAAQANGEPIGAALLWEQLVAGFRDSPFRSTALQRTAEVYAQARNPAKAASLYAQLVSEYPDEASAIKADVRLEELRYQTLGLSEKEAELTVRIARGTRAESLAATLELARLYVLGGGKNADTGSRMLQDLIAQGESKGQALYLLGEYYYRKGDLLDAGRQFVSAAAEAGSDAEFAASAIYRAAEMMKLAGRSDDLKALVTRLETSFPGSPWTAKAKQLREGSL